MNSEMIKGIKFAIRLEKKSQKIYSLLYKKSKDENTKALFEILFTEEVKHEQILTNFLKQGSLKDALSKVTMYKTTSDESRNEFNILLSMKYSSSFRIGNIGKGMKIAMEYEQEALNR